MSGWGKEERKEANVEEKEEGIYMREEGRSFDRKKSFVIHRKHVVKTVQARRRA